jgi:two-component system invasion response regulator UvrY
MKILIVDDHDIVRESLDSIIRTEFAQATIVKAGSAKECIDVLTGKMFDLIILDLGLPDQDGIELIKSILAISRDFKILVFSMSATLVYAPALYEMGIYGFLNKHADLLEIRMVIRSIALDGKRYLPTELRPAVLFKEEKGVLNIMEILSPREKAIAQFIVQGMSTNKIAVQLGIQMSTVRTYKSRIFSKLEVDTLYEFLTKAKLYGLS